MCIDALWLALLALSLPQLSQCGPLFVLTAPNVLRVGSKENVFVEAQGYTGKNFSVQLLLKDFPARNREIFSKTVTLSETNNFQALQEILISEDFFKEIHSKQYVYLEAKFPQQELEKVVLVSFQSGYIFIQTDKTIYTPVDTVHYRIFALNPSLEPSTSGVSLHIMTPDGFTVQRDFVYPDSGVKSGQFKLPEVVSLGTWEVVCRFQNMPEKSFTSHFEVKEYVLPSFVVKLEPEKPFFYFDDPELSVDITAWYLYGKEVSGVAFVVFGVIMQDGEKKSFPSSLQRVDVVDGKGKVILKRDHIVKTFPDIKELVKLSLYVSVSVLTRSGSEMVEAERRGIQIVTSPYTIHFQKTATYFKPGMPFDVVVHVTSPDQTPAKNIDVEVIPGAVIGRTQENGVAKVTINTEGGATSLPITVRTKDPSLTNERQAVEHMTALSYRTVHHSMNYLHISVQAAELDIGDDLRITLNMGNDQGVQDQVKDFTYLITSKGQLVRAEKYERQKGQSLVALSLTVTKDMVPSFRIVAYYHVGTEVVSDSVWVDVKDTCLGKLEVTTTRPKHFYEPRKPFSLSVTGDPGAKVGLVAVDKGGYILNNKNRLTQTKVWDIIEKHDIGCTPGSGADSMGVFYDAGLAFESNAGGTKPRTEPRCPAQTKRRRQRSLKLTSLENSLGQEEDEEYVSEFDILSRTQFPESWLWGVETLLPCPADRRDCTSTSIIKDSYVKDSITTWEVMAISLSKSHGICVAEPFEMKVMKDFSIDLNLPYTAVRNEQLEARAVLHNFLEEDITVLVQLMETAGVCSVASKRRKHRVPEVRMKPMSSHTVAFVIIPMALGLHSIEVKAAVHGSFLIDGVKKDLRVVAEGVQTKKDIMTVALNPSELGGFQSHRIDAVKLSSKVPGSPAHTYISVTGDLPSQTIPAAIGGSALGSLIAQPTGDGEVNMITMTGPVIATHYLDRTLHWDQVGIDRRTQAIKFITIGYTQQLAYRKTDGSYSIWRDRSSSTWLTAYVAKIFGMAYQLITIEEDVLCSALKWLVLNTQQPEGIFKENSPVLHGEIMGGVRGRDSDASLTAYVLIAMQESRHICEERVENLSDSMRKASRFLSRRMHSLTNPYAVALTAYALANEGQHQLDTLFHFSYGETHWPVPGSHLSTLEATAYALMALVKAKEIAQAGLVVKWLTKQKFHNRGYGSTQAMVTVLQALALHRMEAHSVRDIDLQVSLHVAGRSKPVKWSFVRDSDYVTRTERVRIDETLTVTARGTGKGMLSVVTVYNALPEERREDCKNFELTVKLEKEPKVTSQNALETYRLSIEMRYLSPERDATMSILDITMLTGFIADKKDLSRLTSGKDRYVQKIETDKQLSEKGSIVFYLDKVSHKQSDRVVFRMHKTNRVGLLQPAAVTVYEYNSLENRCVKFYHPEKEGGALNRICHEDVCRCAEEDCSYQKKQQVTDLDREIAACEAGMDYVYKATVVHANLSHSIDRFTILVEDIIKEGTDRGVKGKQRTFVAHPQCREALDLIQGKTYLIMGKSQDLIQGEDRLQYMLGGGTWIELCPMEVECLEPVYRCQE